MKCPTKYNDFYKVSCLHGKTPTRHIPWNQHWLILIHEYTLLLYLELNNLLFFCYRHSTSLQDLASSLKIPFLETSAKSSDNVERAFLTMASEIHKRLAAEGGGMQGQSKEATGQSAKINSAPLWLGGEKQKQQEASNCCWADNIVCSA